MWFLASRSGQLSGIIKPFRDFSRKADMKIGRDEEEKVSKKENIQNGLKRDTRRIMFHFIANTIPGSVIFICGVNTRE